ncbi:type II toxin-antitoxin system PemK/MazF family toxin [Tenggerimyces flavus]|uniref:type II toxin-antitoxin system PemK/MazF family toxin n=1 Tax=Tenggerimyces flavus TaxID=1708749 RepID=UPI0027DA1973|nr:type II toxin-antitoxin system PemK/MazF family toxin [Tenggerimyces flavus]
MWLVDFGEPVGHEQGGVRPAVVVGSQIHCRFPIGRAMVVPLTSRDRGLDHHVRIDPAGSGLNRPSWARTEDLTAVSTQRFVRSEPLGTASATEIADLSEWLRDLVAFC